MTHPVISGDVDQQMQADVDAHAAPPGMQPQMPMPDPAVMMQALMQQIMQGKMDYVQQALPQAAPGAAPGGQNAGTTPAAFSPQGAGHWREDGHMANVRLDERAFRRIEKFTDKKDEWKEWRAQVLNAVRECDKTFADNLISFENKEDAITDLDLTSTQQQLSATLQSRLITVTGKDAFAIATAAEGQGVEVWRQLSQRFDPQTDARFALLLISLVSYKIGKTQDVQSGLVRWETMFWH